MSNKSGIEWTDATWNPVTGCAKVSQGCKHCYAEREWPRFHGKKKIIVPTPADGCVPEDYIEPIEVSGHWMRPRRFTDVQCHQDRLDQPLRWRKPRRIFVNSMSDLFHEDVPFEFILNVYQIMHAATSHQFQVLTKRPRRALEFYAKYGIGDTNTIPENVWLGVSVEDQQTADERIPLLLQTPAAVRWISAEPLLGKIDLENIQYPAWRQKHEYDPIIKYDVLRGHMKGPDDIGLKKLDWVVAGGESGPKARPSHPDWFHSLRDQCVAAGVPYFFKQWGEWFPGEAPAWPENADYQVNLGKGYYFDNGQWMERVGKKLAGNLLDGVKWEQYPQ